MRAFGADDVVAPAQVQKTTFSSDRPHSLRQEIKDAWVASAIALSLEADREIASRNQIREAIVQMEHALRGRKALPEEFTLAYVTLRAAALRGGLPDDFDALSVSREFNLG